MGRWGWGQGGWGERGGGGLEPCSHLPADSLSSHELSEESGQSVQHGAFSIPPAGCLGRVWGGLLTTGPFSSQHRTRTDQDMESPAAGVAAGFTFALIQDCHINFYKRGFSYVCSRTGRSH